MGVWASMGSPDLVMTQNLIRGHRCLHCEQGIGQTNVDGKPEAYELTSEICRKDRTVQEAKENQ